MNELLEHTLYNTLGSNTAHERLTTPLLFANAPESLAECVQDMYEQQASTLNQSA